MIGKAPRLKMLSSFSIPSPALKISIKLRFVSRCQRHDIPKHLGLINLTFKDQ